MSLGNETVVLVTPPLEQTDQWGDPIEGAAAVRKKVPGCAVYPAGTDEAGGTSYTVTTGLTALLPVDPSHITSRTVVEYRGMEYRVEGDPARWPWLNGGLACTQLHLEKASDSRG